LEWKIPLFFCAVMSLAAALLAAVLEFTQALSSAGSPTAQHVFLVAIVAFVVTSLRVVFDPDLMR
jgi:uncharacterized membrane protein YtjA (UPF0391 family)